MMILFIFIPCIGHTSEEEERGDSDVHTQCCQPVLLQVHRGRNEHHLHQYPLSHDLSRKGTYQTIYHLIFLEQEPLGDF